MGAPQYEPEEKRTNIVSVVRGIDAYTFQPKIFVILNDEPWFSIGMEVGVHIKYEHNKIDPTPLSSDAVVDEMIKKYQNEFPDLKDEVVKAFDLIKEDSKQRQLMKESEIYKAALSDYVN